MGLGTINGFGIIPLSGRGRLSWEPVSSLQHPWGIGVCDYDGIVCVTAFFIPLVPLSPVHVHSRGAGDGGGTLSESFRALPIRWSLGLLGRVFVPRWLFAGAWLCALSLIFQDTDERRLGSAAFALAWVVSLVVLHRADRRNRALRRVLGRSATGSSDPATWTSEMFQKVRPPPGGYALQVRNAIAQSQFSDALRAARTCVALDDPTLGEQLTDDVLGHRAVAAGLAEIGCETDYRGEFRPKLG
jgi:hypothetical protein